MQTSFTPAQLADPQIATSEQILRKCVHCGFCTATCPTYVTLGNELDSPRGRIYLIKEMLENDQPATQEVVKHVDRCLSCLSCMTTCPSGVHYMHLVDHARAHIEQTYKRPLFDRLNRADMAGIVEIQLHRLEARLAARKIALELDAEARAWLADEGYDPVFGARPLKRVIQRQLQDPLAEMLLAGDILDGSTVVVTAGPEGLIVGDKVIGAKDGQWRSPSALTRELPFATALPRGQPLRVWMRYGILWRFCLASIYFMMAADFRVCFRQP